MLIYDHTYLAEPNLLIPGKKPVGPVHVRQGVHVEQWVMHPVLNGVQATIKSGSFVANRIEIPKDETATKGIQFIKSFKRPIESFPFGILVDFVLTGTSLSGYFGYCGMWDSRGTVTGNSCMCGYRGFNNFLSGRAYQGYNTIVSYPSPTSISQGDKVVLALVSYSATNHKSYALVNNVLYTNSSATDISSWSYIYYDSLAIGGSWLRNTTQDSADTPPIDAYTAMAFSGLSEAAVLELLRDPYMFLEPSI